jgi:hypothetical protein
VYEQAAGAINGTKTLRVSYTDSSGSKITTGNLCGVRPVGDGTTNCNMDNWAVGAL